MQRWRVYLQQFMPDMRVVKAPALKPYVGLLTFSAASLAIALGITLQKYITFEYHSNAGVVGWLSANAYPKQQEYFFLSAGTARYSDSDMSILARMVGLFTLVCQVYRTTDRACA